MKYLLIGLMLLGSFSTFASDCAKETEQALISMKIVSKRMLEEKVLEEALLQAQEAGRNTIIEENKLQELRLLKLGIARANATADMEAAVNCLKTLD